MGQSLRTLHDFGEHLLNHDSYDRFAVARFELIDLCEPFHKVEPSRRADGRIATAVPASETVSTPGRFLQP